MIKRRWGLSTDEWAEAKQRLASLLGDAAGRRGTVTYGEAARVAFQGRFDARSAALMDLLSDVDSEMDAESGIMIASLVVRADTGMPGDGYFKFAAEELDRRALDDPRGFWLEEVRRVWEHFGGQEGPSMETLF